MNHNNDIRVNYAQKTGGLSFIEVTCSSLNSTPLAYVIILKEHIVSTVLGLWAEAFYFFMIHFVLGKAKFFHFLESTVETRKSCKFQL